MDEGVVIAFSGRLPVASFGAFARHRAGRLSLGLDVLEEAPDAATYRVTGPADLVDAFEIALSLGPADCMVETVERPGGPRERA